MSLARLGSQKRLHRPMRSAALSKLLLAGSLFMLVGSVIVEKWAIEVAPEPSVRTREINVPDVFIGTSIFVISMLTIWRFFKRKWLASTLRDNNPNHWEYAAEGALNVAVRYIGNKDSLKGKVLRLRKKNKLSRIRSSSTPLSEGSVLDEEDPFVEDDLGDTLTKTNSFVHDVMMKLLGSRFVAKSEVVKLSTKFIDGLSKHIDPSRPEKRRAVSVLERNAGFGLIMKDSAQIPCGCSEGCTSYCFELKPKWGFLSTEATEFPIKRRVDRFTMHQLLKQKSDETGEISSYCPLDLFHGGRQGILSSLSILEKYPQNNLRLFINGKLSFPDKTKSPMKVILGSQEIHDDLIEALVETLDGEDVLSRVLKAQTLGPLNDIETVYPIYQELVSKGLGAIDIHEGFEENFYPKVPPQTDEDRIEIVKRFLISCTARDCSIMVTLSPCISPASSSLGKCRDGRWSYEITVVDLDAKPISKMSHYHTVDREIARTYMERFQGLPRSPHSWKESPSHRQSSITSSFS